MENAASRFGQRLAHTEKKYRDRALKKLTVYLRKKIEWTDLEWDKLWKALFYCMWMSDKRPVQEELSSNLASLVHVIPHAPTALQFVHSFFRTMHREWHGLDGLRLDKFYSLVRKFVRETVALLRVQNWDDQLLQAFVFALSNEIVSQLPNGLRMHVADLYLAEIHNAASNEITTEAFLTLLEPFLTLLNNEHDPTVFKRMRQVIFDDMLVKYKFGPQPDKNDKEEETDVEEDEEGEKVFQLVDLAQLQHRIFTIASADDTIERNRSGLYTLYKKLFSITHVDSFQAVQEEALRPKKEEKKPVELVAPATEMGKKDEEVHEEKSATKTLKQSKKRKTKSENVRNDEETVETKVTPQAEAKNKKQKETTHEEKTEANDQKEKNPVKKPSKLQEEDTKKAEPPKSDVVMKSGQSFRRCGSCGGFGKGLIPKDKKFCGHCERSRTTEKKKAAAASKKRKAEALAEVARVEQQEKTQTSRKVTFGKGKALRHAVSVKRLKASSKRVSVPKTDLKGVLKVTTSVKKAKEMPMVKGRKTAAHFF